MKLSYFFLALSAIAMTIIGYWAYHIAHSSNDNNDVVVGIGTAICVIATLGPGLGLSHEDSRVNINMKVLCLAAFVVLTAVNFCYAGFGVSMPYYVIVTGLLLIVFLGLFKTIINIKEL